MAHWILDPLQSGVTDDQGAKRVKRHHRRPRAQSDGGQTIRGGVEGTSQPSATSSTKGKASLLQLWLRISTFPRVNNRRREPHITTLGTTNLTRRDQQHKQACLVTTAVRPNRAVTVVPLVCIVRHNRDSRSLLTPIAAQQGYGQPPPGQHQQYGAPRELQRSQWLMNRIS